MPKAVGAIVLSFFCVVIVRTSVGAQAPASPAWAYGVPPVDAAPVNRNPNAAGNGGPRQPDASLKHVPGSTQEFTLAHIRDYWDVGDWFPGDHPPMPTVVVHGRQPHVRGCAMCHMPSGKGRPENAPVAGQPYAYIVQQLMDFKHGLRVSAEPRKTNTAQMIEAATDMTDEEIKEAATYFSSMKWTQWITVRESATVPRTRLAGNVFLPLPGTDMEPIGDRIIEA
ncbi:MAG TPA: c-type cytochrome, partial [Vicinamibacterales bacterium]